MAIGRRRFDRLYPKPPATPEGMVYATVSDELGNKRTKLVSAKKFQDACKRSIGHLDELPEGARLKAKETGDVPDLQSALDKAEGNKRTAVRGIGRAF